MLPVSPTYQQQQIQNIQTQIAQLSQLLGQPAVTVPAIPQNTQISIPQQQIPTVNGIDGARAYQLGANSSIALFDMSEDKFYFVSTDVNGTKAPIKVGKFTIETEASETEKYITRKDFDEFKADIKQLLSSNNVRKNQEAHRE